MADSSLRKYYGQDFTVEDWQHYYDWCRRNGVCTCDPNHPCRQCETAMVRAHIEGANRIFPRNTLLTEGKE